MKKAAFFDLDKTLYSGYSASDFVEFLSKTIPEKSEYGKTYINCHDEFVSGKLTYEEIGQIVLDLYSKSVKGMTKEEAMRHVNAMMDETEEELYEWSEELVRTLERNGFYTVIVSGTSDMIAEYFHKRLGTDSYFGSVIPFDGNIYTGEGVLVVNGNEKCEKIKGIIERESIDESWAFGDSPGDQNMLDIADKGFVVDHGKYPELYDLAKEREWFLFKDKAELLEHILARL